MTDKFGRELLQGDAPGSTGSSRFPFKAEEGFFDTDLALPWS